MEKGLDFPLGLSNLQYVPRGASQASSPGASLCSSASPKPPVMRQSAEEKKKTITKHFTQTGTS